MPRCYMVKKQTDKSESPVRSRKEGHMWRDCAPQTAAPVSPAEACVAPPYCSPQTNGNTLTYIIIYITFNIKTYLCVMNMTPSSLLGIPYFHTSFYQIII